jgi:hypothetical protein
MPAYNEEDRILVTITDTVAFLEEKKAADPCVGLETPGAASRRSS